jgi:hypothetical protein
MSVLVKRESVPKMGIHPIDLRRRNWLCAERTEWVSVDAVEKIDGFVWTRAAVGKPRPAGRMRPASLHLAARDCFVNKGLFIWNYFNCAPKLKSVTSANVMTRPRPRLAVLAAIERNVQRDDNCRPCAVYCVLCWLIE